jgi:hypothetical protein
VLYTILMEYRGETYVSQAKAASASGALRTWSHNLDPSPVHTRRKADLLKMIESHLADGIKPSRLEGLQGSWCQTVHFSGGFALINIVATAV